MEHGQNTDIFFACSIRVSSVAGYFGFPPLFDLPSPNNLCFQLQMVFGAERAIQPPTIGTRSGICRILYPVPPAELIPPMRDSKAFPNASEA